MLAAAAPSMSQIATSCARCRKPVGDRPADAARRAGDDRDVALEIDAVHLMLHKFAAMSRRTIAVKCAAAERSSPSSQFWSRNEASAGWPSSASHKIPSSEAAASSASRSSSGSVAARSALARSRVSGPGPSPNPTAPAVPAAPARNARPRAGSHRPPSRRRAPRRPNYKHRPSPPDAPPSRAAARARAPPGWSRSAPTPSALIGRGRADQRKCPSAPHNLSGAPGEMVEDVIEFGSWWG